MSSSAAAPREREGLVYALVGPAGSGKTTLCSRLIEDFSPSITLSVSVTTRQARTGEKDGIDYHFISREEFDARVKRGELFEWEEVHGNLYGTLNATLEKTIRVGEDLLLDIDIRGAVSFKKKLPRNTIICFIAPPSSEALIQRISSRSKVEEDELQRRLATAAVEYKTFLDLARSGDMVDYIVMNDDWNAAYGQVRAQFLAERGRVSRVDQGFLERICSVK